jgi:hypothetical protein
MPTMFLAVNLKCNVASGDVGANGLIILNVILKEWTVRMRITFIRLRTPVPV